MPQVVAPPRPVARVRGGREDGGDDGPGGVPEERRVRIAGAERPVPHEPALRQNRVHGVAHGMATRRVVDARRSARAARGRTGAVAVGFPPRAFLLRPIHGGRTERVGVTEPVSARGRGYQRNRVRDGTRWSMCRTSRQ